AASVGHSGRNPAGVREDDRLGGEGEGGAVPGIPTSARAQGPRPMSKEETGAADMRRDFGPGFRRTGGRGRECKVPAEGSGRGIPPPSVSERSTPGSSPGEDRGAPPSEGGDSARPSRGGRHGGGVKPRPRAAAAWRRSRGRTTDGAPEGGISRPYAADRR
ncbi:hypothetical protein THAOC_11061, partial [Thalassiosira oceanica]